MESTNQAPSILVFDDAEEVARAAAERFVEYAQEAVGRDGRFSVALAGGSTPRRAYELLASEKYSGRVEWPKVHIFFGDERCVPPDNDQSNYRMAQLSLLSHVPVPAENIHRMVGEGDAAANAHLYEDEMRGYFDGLPWPRFDLILLGMGDDGHTASLFPGTTAILERRAWAISNWVEKFKTFRITLTAPAINQARHVVFVVTGAGKADVLEKVLRGTPEPERLPSQLIHPADGTLEWLLDQQAAVRL